MLDLKNQTLLVIAPHPDDEVLGAGGLIQKIKSTGGKVYVLFLTVGTTRDFSRRGSSGTGERQKEIENVAKYLKFDDYQIGFVGDKFHLKLDSHGQLAVMQLIERNSTVAIEKVKPDMVAFPSIYSYNQDHQLVARASHAALRPAENKQKHFVKLAIAYEVPADGWSMNHQIVPNTYLPLTKREITIKKKAMSLYKSQMRPPPNPRSLPVIESLARLRGAHAGSDFAEGYVGYRIIL